MEIIWLYSLIRVGMYKSFLICTHRRCSAHYSDCFTSLLTKTHSRYIMDWSNAYSRLRYSLDPPSFCLYRRHALNHWAASGRFSLADTNSCYFTKSISRTRRRRRHTWPAALNYSILSKVHTCRAHFTISVYETVLNSRSVELKCTNLKKRISFFVVSWYNHWTLIFVRSENIKTFFKTMRNYYAENKRCGRHDVTILSVVSSLVVLSPIASWAWSRTCSSVRMWITVQWCARKSWNAVILSFVTARLR